MYRYDFTCGVGTTNKIAKIEVPGNYVYYYTGTGPGDPSIRLRAPTGGLDCVLLPGEGVRLTQSQSLYLIESIAGGTALTGVLLIGNGAFESNRLSGNVSVNNALTPNNQALSVADTPGLGIALGRNSQLGVTNPRTFTSATSVGNSSLTADGLNPGTILFRSSVNFQVMKLRVRKSASATPSGFLITITADATAALGIVAGLVFRNGTPVVASNILIRKGIFITNAIPFPNSIIIYRPTLSLVEEEFDIPLGSNGLLLLASQSLAIRTDGSAADHAISITQAEFLEY